MDFIQTLLRPDREDHPKRSEIGRAANLLQIGEFQLLQLAYREWFRREMPKSAMDDLFHSYMVRSEVPFWAGQFARRIIELEKRGSLNDRDPAYHRYDVTYTEHVPQGMRRFIVAVLVIAGLLCGGVLFSHLTVGNGTSVLPPYFDEHELMPRRPGLGA